MKYLNLNLLSAIASLFSKTSDHKRLSENENGALEHVNIGAEDHLGEDAYQTLRHGRRTAQEPFYDISLGNMFINSKWNLNCLVRNFIFTTRSLNLNITCTVIGTNPLEYVLLITKSGVEGLNKGDETLVDYRDSGMKFTGNYLEIHSTQRKVAKFIDNNQLRLSQVTTTFGQIGPRKWTDGEDMIFERVPTRCFLTNPFCPKPSEEVCMPIEGGGPYGQCLRAKGVKCEGDEGCDQYGEGWKCTFWTAQDAFRRGQKRCCKTKSNACH